MESLESEEWEEIYKALWNSEVFLNEVADLKANGIDIDILLDEAKAIFGKFQRKALHNSVTSLLCK